MRTNHTEEHFKSGKPEYNLFHEIVVANKHLIQEGFRELIFKFVSIKGCQYFVLCCCDCSSANVLAFCALFHMSFVTEGFNVVLLLGSCDVAAV